MGRIVLDTRIELGRVSRIAGEMGKTQKVLMRITPGVEADTHEYIKTGCEDSKFGFTMLEDFAFNCVGDVLNAPNVELVGFHCHIGSQIFALHSFDEAVQVMVEFVARVRERYGIEVEDLDMGGGLGIAYTVDENPSSIREFAECTANAVRKYCAQYSVPEPRLLVEPGRSLVANAGVTLYTVGVMKTLPNIRKYVGIDGGMSDNIRTALYHADYEAVIANKADEPRVEIVTLCGKHCESGDAVVLGGSLQHADLGDIVCTASPVRPSCSFATVPLAWSHDAKHTKTSWQGISDDSAKVYPSRIPREEHHDCENRLGRHWHGGWRLPRHLQQAQG